jgi:hypothetical protein
VRTPKEEAQDTDWHAWGLAKNKKPIDGHDGFMYCCKIGLSIEKAREKAVTAGKPRNHKACPYHNEEKRDAGARWRK